MNEISSNSEDGAEKFLRKQCPGTEVVRKIGPTEAPVCNAKMSEMLGIKEEHGWRKKLPDQASYISGVDYD
jgi:hypothetical protein